MKNDDEGYVPLNKTQKSSRMNFEKMCEQINDCFQNKDVEARVCESGGFMLRIEERDIQFRQDLTFVGRGSNLMYVKPEAA